jgi:translin
VSGPADLQSLSEPIRAQLTARHQAREVAIQAGREATRAAANAIRAVHRGDGERADELLATSRRSLDVAVDACAPHPEVLYAGFVQDAAKEHAEAAMTRAVVGGRPVPTAEEVGVDGVSWLHGLAETVGELRRASLDRVRLGDLEQAESLLEVMQEILSTLATIDVPDGLSRGLRRATDAARAITERTRGDLTTAAGQRELRAALDAHRGVLERALEADGHDRSG